jgi:hypothetical protein
MSRIDLIPSTAQRHAPAANTAAVVTLPATTGKAHTLTLVSYNYSGAPTGGSLAISDGGTTVYEQAVTATGPGEVSLPLAGIAGTTGNAVTITLAAGGASVTRRLNIASA